MTQIYRMAKPGLLSGQQSSIGLLSSSRLQNARAGFPNISPAGTRSFWSHDGRFGKTWRELLALKDKYLASTPRVEGDGPKQPALKPLQPVLYEEPAVLEHVSEFWVSISLLAMADVRSLVVPTFSSCNCSVRELFRTSRKLINRERLRQGRTKERRDLYRPMETEQEVEDIRDRQT